MWWSTDSRASRERSGPADRSEPSRRTGWRSPCEPLPLPPRPQWSCSRGRWRSASSSRACVCVCVCVLRVWSVSRPGAGQIQAGVLWDLDGLLHCRQQPVPSFSSQSGTETLGPTNQELHHHTGVLLHALAWDDKHPALRATLMNRFHPVCSEQHHQLHRGN